MAEITMPQLGETVTEGTIIRWLKNVGDPVAHDEPLFEVSTDKVDSEVPSSESGFLTKILVEEGETVDVGTALAVISETAGEGGEPAATPAAAPDRAPSPDSAATPEGTGAGSAAGTAAVPDAAGPVAAGAAAAPPAQAPAAQAPAAQAPAAQTPAAQPAEGPAVVLSPVVRNLLRENGIEASDVTGTGAGGRITRNDVLAYLDKHNGANGAAAAGGARAVAPPAPAAPGAGGGAPAAYGPASAGERDEVIPFTNIRRLTAEHMVRSKATSAHTLAVIEADYEAIEKVRRAHKDRFREEEGFGLTYLPFVARAVVDVLRDFPNLNASVGADALIVHRDVNLGIAVDLDRQGLIVPVVKNADGQSLRGLARAMSDLANRARNRHLSADDIVGGTFTITNPGPFGTFITAPIINQPQVAILSTDGVKRRPVVVTGPDGSEAIAIHSVGMLALSFDHRAIDGAYASAFLHALAGALESRDWAAEL